MGHWAMHIEGHGIHDNGLDSDAEARLKSFVGQLIDDGHEQVTASFTVGSTRDYVPAAEGESPHYRHR